MSLSLSSSSENEHKVWPITIHPVSLDADEKNLIEKARIAVSFDLAVRKGLQQLLHAIAKESQLALRRITLIKLMSINSTYYFEQLNQATDRLLVDLEQDPLTIDAAKATMAHIGELASLLKKNILSNQIITIQVKFIRCFFLAIEQTTFHYEAKRIWVLSKDFLQTLTKIELRLLNITHKADPELEFIVKITQKAIQYLKHEESKKLNAFRDTLEAVHGLKSLWHTNIDQFLQRSSPLFKNLNALVKKNWYGALHCLKTAEIDAINGSGYDLSIIQRTIVENQNKKINWKFCVGAIEILKTIAKKTTHLAIKQEALFGHQSRSGSFPGLLNLYRTIHVPKIRLQIQRVLQSFLNETSYKNETVQSLLQKAIVQITQPQTGIPSTLKFLPTLSYLQHPNASITPLTKKHLGLVLATPANHAKPLNGKQCYSFSNGDSYEGNFCNNQMHGLGIYKFADGMIYGGDLSHNKITGEGLLKFRFGGMYLGPFVEGKKVGKGVYKFADGKVYKGDFLNDQMTGTGKWTLANGDSYEGYVLNGLRHGKGRYFFSNGCSYEGDFLHGEMTGNGTFKLNGDVYTGEVREGFRHGKGLYKCQDGRISKGTFQDGLFTNGEIKYINQDVYEGPLLKGKRHGIGKYTFANGDVYVGSFIMSNKEGDGVYTYANGNIYEGKFSKDKITGEGKVKLKNGIVYDAAYLLTNGTQ